MAIYHRQIQTDRWNYLIEDRMPYRRASRLLDRMNMTIKIGYMSLRNSEKK